MKKNIILFSLLLIFQTGFSLADNNINYYGPNDSINFIKGYGEIHFRNNDMPFKTELLMDVYKDLILVKDKHTGQNIIYTTQDIDYIIIQSAYDSSRYLMIAPMDLDVYNGFFSIRILGDVGFLGKLFVYDYVDITGTLVYDMDYIYYLLLGDEHIVKLRTFWTIRKDIIKNLPKHQDRLKEIYDEMDMRKLDKRNKEHDPEKVEAVEYLFEIYNQLENENYEHEIKYIRDVGF